MGLRRLRWLLLLTVVGAVALWPLAASSSAGEDNATPKVKFDYAKRQNFIGGEWVRFRVRTNELTIVNASGNLEVGSAPKKTYGRNLFPIGGVSEKVKRGEEKVLRMHVPKNVRVIAHRARAAGKQLVIRVNAQAFDNTGNTAPDFVAVIRPTP